MIAQAANQAMVIARRRFAMIRAGGTDDVRLGDGRPNAADRGNVLCVRGKPEAQSLQKKQAGRRPRKKGVRRSFGYSVSRHRQTDKAHAAGNQ
jgi:hypothetical protein